MTLYFFYRVWGWSIFIQNITYLSHFLLVSVVFSVNFISVISVDAGWNSQNYSDKEFWNSAEVYPCRRDKRPNFQHIREWFKKNTVQQTVAKSILHQPIKQSVCWRCLMSICACHFCLFSLCWPLSLRNSGTSASLSVMSPLLGNSPSAFWRQRTWRRWMPVDYPVQKYYNHFKVRML